MGKTITTNRLLQIQAYLLILIVSASLWSQWSFESLSTDWTELQTKLFMYDWVPILIRCAIILCVAVISFYKKPLAFALTFLVLSTQIIDAIGNIIQIPQNGVSYFFIIPQFWAVFITIAFIVSIIGGCSWLSSRRNKR